MRKNIQKAFVLDIGSTSVRLLIGERIDGGEIKILVNTGVVTHLQASMKPRTEIDFNAAKKTFDAVDELLSNADIQTSGKGAVICTQSVRQAADPGMFLAYLERLAGVKPEVLSKVREGQLAFKGSESLVGENDLMIDFGGGSTEIVVKDSEGDLLVQSISIGSGSLLPIDRRRIRAGETSFSSVIELADQQWATLLSDVDIFRKESAVVVGGTTASLGSIYWGYKTFRSEMLHGKRFSLDELMVVIRALSRMSDEEIGFLSGMEAGRQSIVFNGGCLLISLCRLLGVQHLTLSEQGIRFGRLFELLHEA